MDRVMVKRGFLNFSRNLENAISNILFSITSRGLGEAENSNSDIYFLLKNKEDEKKFNDTIEFLKQNKNEKSKEIALSNKHSLTVSID